LYNPKIHCSLFKNKHKTIWQNHNIKKEVSKMKDREYAIRLFTNAVGPAREKSRFTYLNYYGETVDIPYIIWNIEGAD